MTTTLPHELLIPSTLVKVQLDPFISKLEIRKLWHIGHVIELLNKPSHWPSVKVKLMDGREVQHWCWDVEPISEEDALLYVMAQG